MYRRVERRLGMENDLRWFSRIGRIRSDFRHDLCGASARRTPHFCIPGGSTRCHTHSWLVIYHNYYCLQASEFNISYYFIVNTEQDAVGVTIVLLTCSYRGQEFVRVGYFINNDYTDPELKENPPSKPQFDKLTRNILASKPRVTRFKINWDDSNNVGQNGGNLDENSESAEFFQNHHLGQKFDDEVDMDQGAVGGTIAIDARINENSNSLAMDC